MESLVTLQHKPQGACMPKENNQFTIKCTLYYKLITLQEFSVVNSVSSTVNTTSFFDAIC